MENHFAWALVNERWLDPENFAKGPAHFFDGAPEAVREMVLDEVRRNVRAAGIGRHSDLEIVALAVRSLAAVSAMLGDKPYLFGRRPCGADATVFALLGIVLDGLGVLVTRYAFDSAPGIGTTEGNFYRALGALASFVCVLLLLAPALWNGFPLLQYDTGGYLALGPPYV